jgi:hypothetical protein
LYAKRDPSGNLECDPDAVMETAPFDATTASSFLSENCPAFFEDITDLAVAMETFSDADVLEGSGWRSRRVRVAFHCVSLLCVRFLIGFGCARFVVLDGHVPRKLCGKHCRSSSDCL